MSTPSGKSFDPFDLSPYAPKRARERTALDEGDSKQDPAAVPPYAPRAALPPAEDPPLGFHVLGSSGIEQKPTASVTRQTDDEPLGEEPVADDAGSESPEAPVTELDPALARLEASLQWIQREGSAPARMPRVAPLPPVSGLRPLNTEGLRPRGEQFINGVRVPPSLAPERLRPPPMRERRDNLRGPVRVLLATVIAAPIAYYFSVGSFTGGGERGHESGLASLASRLVASAEFPLPKDKLPPGEADDYNTMVSSRNKLVVAPPPTAAAKVAPVPVEAPADDPVVVVPPPSPAVEETPAKPTRQMDAASIKLLMQQGEQVLASGDVLAARIVYQRAAEAGDAAAALALGATYDPSVLAKMGVRGVSGDTEKARMWYERAKEYGSSDAPRRLDALASAGAK